MQRVGLQELKWNCFQPEVSAVLFLRALRGSGQPGGSGTREGSRPAAAMGGGVGRCLATHRVFLVRTKSEAARRELLFQIPAERVLPRKRKRVGSDM